MKLVSVHEDKTLLPILTAYYAAYNEKAKAVATAKIQERVQEEDRDFFLLQNEKQYVGFAEVFIIEECFPDEDLPESCMKVLAFYIDPKMRRRGFGSQFFKLLRSWAHDREIALVEIEVPSGNTTAESFVKQIGLELVGSGTKSCYRSFV